MSKILHKLGLGGNQDSGNELHRMGFIPCMSWPAYLPASSGHKPCHTLIGIALDMGPAAFRCPVCNSIYIVDPLEKGSQEKDGLGFGVLELDGHRIEMYDYLSTQEIRTVMGKAQAFYGKKVGGLQNVYVASVHSEPGAGLL